MRLFVAIPLPEDLCQYLAAVAQELIVVRLGYGRERGISFVRPENMHLTLKFLGEVPDAQVPALRAALAKLPPRPPLNVFPLASGYFPPRGPVNVVVATVGGDTDALVELAGQVERGCEPLGFPREQRAFKPHITVARAKGRIPGGKRWDDALEGSLDRRKAFVADAMTLFRSDLRPAGPVYSVVATFPFQKGAEVATELGA